MNAKEDYERRLRRYQEFPDTIRLLGYKNPTVRRVMDMYAAGEIITLQEAAFQMVSMLVQENDHRMKQIVEMNHHCPFPPTLSVQN